LIPNLSPAQPPARAARKKKKNCRDRIYPKAEISVPISRDKVVIRGGTAFPETANPVRAKSRARRVIRCRSFDDFRIERV
jgi:hypothetical protein